MAAQSSRYNGVVDESHFDLIVMADTWWNSKQGMFASFLRMISALKVFFVFVEGSNSDFP